MAKATIKNKTAELGNVLGSNRRCPRINGVIQLREGGMPFNIQGCQLVIGYGKASGVSGLDERRLDGKASGGSRVPNAIQGQIKGCQGCARPRVADLAEQTMFNRVPFGRAGWVMGYGDDQAKGIR